MNPELPSSGWGNAINDDSSQAIGSSEAAVLQLLEGEQRFITLGLLQGRFVAVIHAEINGETRIISMRKGAKHEQRIFSENI